MRAPHIYTRTRTCTCTCKRTCTCTCTCNAHAHAHAPRLCVMSHEAHLLPAYTPRPPPPAKAERCATFLLRALPRGQEARHLRWFAARHLRGRSSGVVQDLTRWLCAAAPPATSAAVGSGGGGTAAAAPLPRWQLAAWLMFQPLPPPPRLELGAAAAAREAREVEESGRARPCSSTTKPLASTTSPLAACPRSRALILTLSLSCPLTVPQPLCSPLCNPRGRLRCSLTSLASRRERYAVGNT
jgi:hypothetical protein